MKYLFSIVLFAVFCSCEEEIELDLQNAESISTIEAYADAGLKELWVKVTQTMPYLQAGIPPIDSMATVSVINQTTRERIDVPYDSKRKMHFAITSNNFFSVGTSYSLTVRNSKGKSFQANEALKRGVRWDSVAVTRADRLDPSDPLVFFRRGRDFSKLYQVRGYFTDIKGVGDSYYYSVIRNDSAITSGQFDDVNFNSFLEGGQFIANSNRLFNHGDSLTLKLQAVQESYTKYLNQLSSIRRGGGFSIPGNPPLSNIVGEGVGYFAVVNSHDMVVVLGDKIKLIPVN